MAALLMPGIRAGYSAVLTVISACGFQAKLGLFVSRFDLSALERELIISADRHCSLKRLEARRRGPRCGLSTPPSSRAIIGSTWRSRQYSMGAMWPHSMNCSPFSPHPMTTSLNSRTSPPHHRPTKWCARHSAAPDVSVWRGKGENANFTSRRAFPSHGRGRRFNPYSAHQQIKDLRTALKTPHRKRRRFGSPECVRRRIKNSAPDKPSRAVNLSELFEL
jgi:hypothetical protein